MQKAVGSVCVCGDETHHSLTDHQLVCVGFSGCAAVAWVYGTWVLIMREFPNYRAGRGVSGDGAKGAARTPRSVAGSEPDVL